MGIIQFIEGLKKKQKTGQRAKSLPVTTGRFLKCSELQLPLLEDEANSPPNVSGNGED